jgi:hypothetical protein
MVALEVVLSVRIFPPPHYLKHTYIVSTPSIVTCQIMHSRTDRRPMCAPVKNAFLADHLFNSGNDQIFFGDTNKLSYPSKYICAESTLNLVFYSVLFLFKVNFG